MRLASITAWLADPAVTRVINGWLTIAAVVLIPVSVRTGWIDSLRFVSFASLWALVAAHWSTWAAALAACAQRGSADEVVDVLIDRTEIDPA